MRARWFFPWFALAFGCGRELHLDAIDESPPKAVPELAGEQAADAGVVTDGRANTDDEVWILRATSANVYGQKPDGASWDLPADGSAPDVRVCVSFVDDERCAPVRANTTKPVWEIAELWRGSRLELLHGFTLSLVDEDATDGGGEPMCLPVTVVPTSSELQAHTLMATCTAPEAVVGHIVYFVLERAS